MSERVFRACRLFCQENAGQSASSFLIDTGFEGELSLPSNLAAELDAVHVGQRPVQVADGTQQRLPATSSPKSNGTRSRGRSRCLSLKTSAVRNRASRRQPAHHRNARMAAKSSSSRCSRSCPLADRGTQRPLPDAGRRQAKAAERFSSDDLCAAADGAWVTWQGGSGFVVGFLRARRQGTTV